MNAMVKTGQHSVAAVGETELIEVMQDSLYPGAKTESVRMVLSYCRARGLDPMLKPVHIVPMSVKVAGTRSNYEWRDVILPGIALYRIQAARTNQYAGKSEPEYGPDVKGEFSGSRVTHPLWCKVTVSRLVNGHVREFTAKEYWLENYATAGKDTDRPNTMWAKRPYGQLAKCTESQALRMAFPEETGGEPTGEEMEGKSFEGVTLDGKAERPQPGRQIARDATIPALDTPAETLRAVAEQVQPRRSEPPALEAEADAEVDEDREKAAGFVRAMRACKTDADLSRFTAGRGNKAFIAWMEENRPDLAAEIAEARGQVYESLIAAVPDAASAEAADAPAADPAEVPA